MISIIFLLQIKFEQWKSQQARLGREVATVRGEHALKGM
jgi:hypothetical protein